MGFTAIENTPIVINLLAQANYTGWSVDGDIATHSSCQQGSIKLTTYPLTADAAYEISYAVLSITGGYVQLFAGTTGGIQRTTPGIYVEEITANGPQLSFFSNAKCTLQAFNIRNTVEDISNTQKNTLVYSFNNKKWGEYRTIAPDYGFSLYIDMLTIYHGNLYLHENGSTDRNNFYGVQYETIFEFVENKTPALLKNYNGIALQSNELMITTESGITTSFGQVSELAEQDFIKGTLKDTLSVTSIESQYGIYSASFLKDKNIDLINGDPLSGNYIKITLQTVNGNAVLQLFSVEATASQKHIAVR